MSAHGTISFVAHKCQLHHITFCHFIGKKNHWLVWSGSPPRPWNIETLKYIYNPTNFLSSPSNHHKFPFESGKTTTCYLEMKCCAWLNRPNKISLSLALFLISQVNFHRVQVIHYMQTFSAFLRLHFGVEWHGDGKRHRV